MPQLEFITYLYQYQLLFISFILLYDLTLNFWLPGFLNGIFLEHKLSGVLKSLFIINKTSSFSMSLVFNNRLLKRLFPKSN